MSDQLPPGSVVAARYEVQAFVGQGGLGAVYRARDLVLEETVALKVFRPELVRSEELVARLRSDIKLARTVRHKNVCWIYEYGEDGPLRYIVMEFVPGQDLREVMRIPGRITSATALDYSIQTAEGLAALHDAGIILSDLKPSKVMVDAAGRVRLMHSGLARLPATSGTRTGAGVVMGPADFLSPEQVRGESIDQRADIYALGVVMYELFTARLPFTEDSFVANLHKRLQEDPPFDVPGLESPVRPVVEHALARDVALRYQRVADLLSDLRALAPRMPNRPADTGAFPRPSIPEARATAAAPPARPPVVLPTRAAPAASPPRGGVLDVVGGLAGAVGAAAKAVFDWARPKRDGADSRKGPSPEPGLAGPGPVALGDPALDAVEASVFAPAQVRSGERFLVQVFVHLLEQRAQAHKMATLFDASATKRGFRTLARRIARGTNLSFELRVPSLDVAEPVQSLVWNGRPEAVQFGVGFRPDSTVMGGTVVGAITVIVGSVPVGHVKFKLDVVPGVPRLREEASPCEAHPYEMVFISYASEDRGKVLARVQMLDSLRIRYFQDILSLDPGQRWERALYKHIDECDLFLLFWSKAARDSAWVLKEVRYALDRKKGDELLPPAIKPVILEGPPPVPPPPELAGLHFNDRLIYFMNAQS